MSLLMCMEHSKVASKLYIDTDADVDFSDEKMLTARRTSIRRQVFPPIPLKGQGGTRLIVQFEVAAPTALLAYPAAMLTGNVKIGDRSYRVFLADGNLDGTYDDAISGAGVPARGSFDVLAIDRNGNRRLETDDSGAIEVMPLPRLLLVGGRAYRVTVSPDGRGIELVEAEEIATGTLATGTPYADLLLWSGSGGYRVYGSGGTFVLPVGSYYPAELGLRKTGAKGAVWTLKAASKGKVGSFQITAGKTTDLRIGPPLVGKVDIRTGNEKEKTLSLGFDIVGCAGETYEPRAFRNGVKQPTPRFKIVDEKGKIWATGDFYQLSFG
jgi:hypothetical protein